jgi:hypothetical protein
MDKQLTLSQVKAICKIYDLKPTEIDFDDYLILTDEEADYVVNEYIKDTLWAFRPSFLSAVTGVDESVFEAIQANNRCEDNNDAVMSIIEATDSWDSLVRDAVLSDGRGHFLAGYDGEENELPGGLFIYRIN